MYICLCHAVSDKKIQLLLNRGKLSLDELRLACNAGDGCGSCVEDLLSMIHSYQQQQKRAASE